MITHIWVYLKKSIYSWEFAAFQTFGFLKNTNKDSCFKFMMNMKIMMSYFCRGYCLPQSYEVVIIPVFQMRKILAPKSNFKLVHIANKNEATLIKSLCFLLTAWMIFKEDSDIRWNKYTKHCCKPTMPYSTLRTCLFYMLGLCIIICKDDYITKSLKD